VDAIVASAGIMGTKELKVRDGVELQFLVNHVGHFALINELIDLVPDHTGRIVIVSSSGSIHQAPKQGIPKTSRSHGRSESPDSCHARSRGSSE
jgi:WW domain-containing oxidoreductase